jgi:cytochrome c peroxidase
MSREKAELGRWLFYDKRLSVDNSTSCASCHVQSKAFTDGQARSLGPTGQHTPRSSMALANVAYHPVLTWGNPLMTSLEVQALVPLTSEEPLEMGFSRRPQEILTTLREDAAMSGRFAASFPEDPAPVRLSNILKALATFQRTLLSFHSPYDRAARGDVDAMSPAARRGHTLFFSERLECFHCHDAPFFSDSTQVAGQPAVKLFHNTGLYAIGPNQVYPEGSTGVFEVTGSANDMGKFRAPTLRNIAVTAPYFHDGSAATLADVLDHYRVGGRTITEGPHAGVGSKHRLKSPFIRGFALSESEKADLIAFLESLTDESFLTNPAFSDPFAP